jgi:DNA-binding transcriptional LysR family regulator
MDTLSSLRMFVEIVRGGSLSSAARKLGVSAATVSRSLDALEHQLGFNLIVKSSRQLGLTEAGATYLPKVERLLLDFDDATASAKGMHSEARGQLNIHARMAVGTICIAPLLPGFLARYPEIDVRLSLDNETDINLIQENIHVDIRTGVLQDSSLIVRKLADSKRVIVASKHYVDTFGVPETPEDLLNHNCLTFRNTPAIVQWHFRSADGKQWAISPKGNLETDNGAVIRHCLRRGVGIGHMTDWAVAQDLRDGTLIRLLEDYEVTVDQFHHGIYAIFTPSRNQSAKVRAFIDYLVGAFRDQASSSEIQANPVR